MFLRNQFLRCSTSSEFPTFVQFLAGELTISPLGVVMMDVRVGSVVVNGITGSFR